MPSLDPRLNRAAGMLAGGVLKLASAGLVVMTGVIAWQVFARYVLNDSPPWSEAAALIVMVSFVMLAAAVGVYEQFHLGFRWLMSKLPIRARRVVFVFSQALILAFGAAHGGERDGAGGLHGHPHHPHARHPALGGLLAVCGKRRAHGAVRAGQLF